jgi:hypothetical protein
MANKRFKQETITILEVKAKLIYKINEESGHFILEVPSEFTQLGFNKHYYADTLKGVKDKFAYDKKRVEDSFHRIDKVIIYKVKLFGFDFNNLGLDYPSEQFKKEFRDRFNDWREDNTNGTGMLIDYHIKYRRILADDPSSCGIEQPQYYDNEKCRHQKMKNAYGYEEMLYTEEAHEFFDNLYRVQQKMMTQVYDYFNTDTKGLLEQIRNNKLLH